MKRYIVNDFGETTEREKFWEINDFFKKERIPKENLTLAQIENIMSLYTSCEDENNPHWTYGNYELHEGLIGFFIEGKDDDTAFRAHRDWEKGVDFEDPDVTFENTFPKPWEKYPNLLCDTSTWCKDEWPEPFDVLSSANRIYSQLKGPAKSSFHLTNKLVCRDSHVNIIQYYDKELQLIQERLRICNDDDVWFWMGTGEEDLPSLCEDVVVKITAGQLRRDFIQKKDTYSRIEETSKDFSPLIFRGLVLHGFQDFQGLHFGYVREWCLYLLNMFETHPSRIEACKGGDPHQGLMSFVNSSFDDRISLHKMIVKQILDLVGLGYK